MYEETKRIIRSCDSKKGRQCNDKTEKDKQWSTEHYTEN